VVLLKPKLHYHTHAASFSGAENMISLFLQSEKMNSQFAVSFSYRYSNKYHEGLRRRVKNFMGESYALRFLHLHSDDQMPFWLPRPVKHLLFTILNLVILYPLFIYEIIILSRLLLKVRPNILHINNAGYPAAHSARAAAIAGRLSGVPKIIMVVNNMAVGYGHFSRWLDYPIDKFVAHSVDIFITGSLSAGERLGLVLKLPDHKLRTIHNGIALRTQSCTITATRKRLSLDNPKCIIFGVVAMLVPRKGHLVLLKAILELVTKKKLQGDEFKIVIEGHGPLQNVLDDYIDNNNLAPWITLVGVEANIVDFMAALDVLILPSVRDEDFPNVILEGMALGKPVIASRLAGTPEQVLDGTTGLLVVPSNITQLAEAVFKLLDNAALRNSMGLAALNRFNNHFDSQIALNKYSDLYGEIIRYPNDKHE
jgi:L-malate glycosyltransferase